MHLLSVAYVVDFGDSHLRPSDPSECIVLCLHFVEQPDVLRIGDAVRVAGVPRVAVLQGVGCFRVLGYLGSFAVVVGG
jgi:hypothetical protein